jgi:hypothetical protein
VAFAVSITMSIEAQYYSIPVATLMGFALSIFFAYRITRAKVLPVSKQLVLWLVWLIATCGLLVLLALVIPFLFLANHPMDPAFSG